MKFYRPSAIIVYHKALRGCDQKLHVLIHALRGFGGQVVSALAFHPEVKSLSENFLNATRTQSSCGGGG